LREQWLGISRYILSVDTRGKQAMATSRTVSDFDRLHTGLAEAVVACRADAGNHEVHAVRTGTRKLEALLRKVEEDHPGAMRLHKASKNARRELKRIRKAAGPVRDLDVHRQLTEELHQHLPSAGEADSSKEIESGYKKLDRNLQERRKRAAANLRKVLKKEELGLQTALAETSAALAHLRAASPPPLTTARKWARNSSIPTAGNFKDNLHSFRKQTKAARYLAGLEKPSAPARRLATQLKQVQDAIGRWHDLMLLTEEAVDILGKRSKVTCVVRAERDRALDVAALNAKTAHDDAAAATHTRSHTEATKGRGLRE
jgi:CHAD domain-containing protein